MDARLIILKLFLDELGIGDEIKTVDDRKKIQKAVYLGQLTGADLGYRFGWYRMGPYSPRLTRNYYALADEVEVARIRRQSPDEMVEGQSLYPEFAEKLQRAKPLLGCPADLDITQEDWLELIASVHFLRTISRYEPDKMLEILQEEKPLLVPYVPLAEEVLRQHGLYSPA